MAKLVEVVFAVYGAINGSGDCKAGNVTEILQKLLNKTSDGIVTINNTSMNYPDIETAGREKHFAAIVKYNGATRAYACQEGQSVIFAAAT